MIYGLVAPGYEMAEIVAANLCGGLDAGEKQRGFGGTDLSTKLKLMGIDVASFGDYEAGPERARPLVYEDPFGGVYKKLLFNLEGTRLLGGVLVGDASDYGTLSMLAKSSELLPCKPGELIVGSDSGSGSAIGGVETMPDAAQICSCNNVTKGQICEQLEQRMQHLVDTYECEWKAVVTDPEKRKRFRQFVNSDQHEPGIEIITEREQCRPADWPKDFVPLSALEKTAVDLPLATLASPRSSSPPTSDSQKSRWVPVGVVDDFPNDGGATIKYGQVQIAVFNFASRGQWYACQNMCPHKKAFVPARGIVGSAGEVPKVSCPLHKKPFSLQTGESLSGEDLSVKVFPVKVESGHVYLSLPPQEQLDALLATDLHEIRACSTSCQAASNG